MHHLKFRIPTAWGFKPDKIFSLYLIFSEEFPVVFQVPEVHLEPIFWFLMRQFYSKGLLINNNLINYCLIFDKLIILNTFSGQPSGGLWNTRGIKTQKIKTAAQPTSANRGNRNQRRSIISQTHSNY